MVDTIIRPGIAYSFYAVPYSMPNITKLEKKIISLQKSMCGLPKSTPNITTKLPHDLFGLDAHSLKTEYLTCIGNSSAMPSMTHVDLEQSTKVLPTTSWQNMVDPNTSLY
jgi:hypothetical protein